MKYQDRLECLVDAVQRLSLARDLESIAAIVRRAARELTGADGATFVLRDDECCYYMDEDAISPLWKGQRFPLETCISGWVMLHRQPVVIPDIYADARIPHAAYRPTFVKSLVMVPIRSLEPIAAIGNYWAHEHHAGAEDVRLLAALADSTAVAMENVRIHAELEERVALRTAQLAQSNALLQEEIARREAAQQEVGRLLVINPMSGLLNRHGFFSGAEPQFADARRDDARCALVFIDLDDLKQRNDEFGHAAGDRMIVDTSRLLHKTFRDGELVGRFGGDEFVVWSARDADANELKRRLHEAIAAFNRGVDANRRLSMSIGAVAAPARDFDNLDQLIARADAAMYADKQARRNDATLKPLSVRASPRAPC